ncbi:hypothetical protein [Nitrosomonas sp.]|uniref:hypothetical protein n=1 Tax=Nitrosomonas sp. TaxID=42353 RepID=UPI001D1C2B5B|nr:hypothetical protein [Nitrosomonas sp.]MBX3616546.1 hypothetical protein [Nitrosomonas sp.]
MKYLIAMIVLMLLISVQAQADIVVVVHPSSRLKNLTQQQIIDIYMGRIHAVEDTNRIVPYDQPQDSELRASFYQHLTGRPVAFINAYWARLLFTGRASPPRQVTDNMSIVDIVEKDPNVIGYIDERNLNDRVSVVFKIITHAQQ